MKLSLPGACFISIIILSTANNCVADTPLSQTHQWIQTLEDKVNQHDSSINNLIKALPALQRQIDSLASEKELIPVKENGSQVAITQEQSRTNLLIALLAGLAILLAIGVSVLVPFYFFRENNRLREEVRNLMVEVQRVKPYIQPVETRETRPAETAVKQEFSPRPATSLYSEPAHETGFGRVVDYTAKKEKERSTIEFITRLELCIIADQEDEFNLVVADIVQLSASGETTALLRYLHRIAACVFRGRMPAQAPVMAEVKQFLWACQAPVYYQTEKIVSWARSSTRLSDTQRGYIFSISSELEKMLAEHNRQYND
jgi:hypothetical protein